jgi:hypothetical protein
VYTNGLWKNIRENIKISAKDFVGYYELKQDKPWFIEDVQTIRLKKISKLQLLQYPSQINGNNLNSMRPIIIKTFQEEKEGISERQNQWTCNTQ